MASPDSEPAADRSAAAQRAERPAIAVRGVVKSFGGITAVDHCSIDVRQGSITGLIGPNGAGKTTLFNIVAGFMRPDGGRIELEGRDVTGMAPHLLFARGLVRTFQIPHEFQRMSVLENLMVVPGRQTGRKRPQGVVPLGPGHARGGSTARQGGRSPRIPRAYPGLRTSSRATCREARRSCSSSAGR